MWRADWGCGLQLGLAIEEFVMSERVGKKINYNLGPSLKGKGRGVSNATKQPEKLKQAKTVDESVPYENGYKALSDTQIQKMKLEELSGLVAALHDRNNVVGRPEWERREIEQRKLLEDKVVIELPPSELAKLDAKFQRLNELREKLSARVPKHYLEAYSAHQFSKESKLKIEKILEGIRYVNALIGANRNRRNLFLREISQNTTMIGKLNLRISKIEESLESYKNSRMVMPPKVNKNNAALEKDGATEVSAEYLDFLEFLELLYSVKREFSAMPVSILHNK
jgi:hypothetical protein